MLNSFPVTLLTGTVLGFLSGVGVGGGSLLILWLTLVLGMDPATARSVNLLFFLPAAAISCRFRRKQGTLNLRRVFPAICTGIAGAVLGTSLSARLDTGILKKAFGFLLILTGIRELLWKKKKAES